MIRIDQWCVVEAPDSDFIAPELRKRCLHGVVTGHPNIDDGSIVTSTPIKGLSGSFIKTYSGSIYELGDVSEEYEKQFPDAEMKLINSLQKKS